MLRNLLILLLVLKAADVFADDGSKTLDGHIIMDTHIFYLTFVDTNFSVKKELHLQYSDTGNHKNTIITMTDDTDITDRIILKDSIDFRDFKTQVNKLALKLHAEHTVSENSLWEIYEWILTQVYGNSAPPLSACLHFAGAVQYFDDSWDNENDRNTSKAFHLRIKTTDTTIDKQAYYSSRVGALTQQIVSNSKSMAAETLKQPDNSAAIQDLEKYIVNVKSKGFEVSSPINSLVFKFLQDSSLLVNEINFPIEHAIEKDLEQISKFLANSNNSASDYTTPYKDIQTKKMGIPAPLEQLFDFITNLPDDTTIKMKIELLNSNKSLSNSVKQMQQAIKENITRKLEGVKPIFNEMLVEKNQKIKKNADSLTALIEIAKRELLRFKQNLGNRNIGDITNVQIQFERGFIENVKVTVEVENEPTIFENTKAAGITSKYNIGELTSVVLFARNANLHIYLADVLRMYDNELDNYTRDYSPADTTISVDPNATPRVFVYKSQFVNLFETKAYTDLAGLSNKEPNGILQIEISRRLNINTTRYGHTPNFNYGWFNYLYVFGTLNKIEKGQRYLPLHNENLIINNTLASPSYASSMDFIQYRNVTGGVELNAITTDFPNMKSTITLDLGAQYGHVPLIDSMRSIDSSGVFTASGDSVYLDANLITLYPKLMLQIFPERRLGLSFSYQPQHTRFLSNNRFRQVTSYAKSDLAGLAQDPISRWSHMFEALVKIEINKVTGSYAFFRGRFYWQQGDVNTFFPQLQIGYSYNLNIVKAANR